MSSTHLTPEDIERALFPGCIYEGKGHPACTQDKLDMARTTEEVGRDILARI